MASIEIASVVSGGAGWTKVRTTDGRTLTIKGTRSTRNNNPGNIEYGKWARRHGAVGSDGRFAVFPSRERGYQAIGELLTSSAYKDKSIKQAIAKYAPAFENNTTAYTNAVARAVGVDKDTKIADLTPEQQAALANAIKTVEAGGGGKATAYDENGTLVATISGRGGAQFAPGQQTITPDIRSAIAATDIFNTAPQIPQTPVQMAGLGGIPLGEARQRAPQVPDGLPIQLASAPRAMPQITRENAPPPTAASMLPTRGPNWTPPPLGTSAMMQPTPQPLGPPGQRNLTPREMGRFVPAMPQTVPSQPSASIGLSMQPVGARGMPTQPPAPPLSAPREVGPAPFVAEAQRVPMEFAGPPGAATQAGVASVLDPLGVLAPGTARREAARLTESGLPSPVTAPRQVPAQPSTASPRRQGQGGAPMSGPAPGQSTQQAIGGIMAGKAPAGYSVRSASNPDVTITSFGPSLGYAHTNSKYGWTETYGPDGSKTTQYGKAVNVTVDPTTGKPTIAYYTPDDAKWGYGLSPGLKARRSRQTTPTTFTPSFASPFSSMRGLGIANPAKGLLAGLANLFAPKTEPMAYFSQQGPIGTAAGMGGLGGSFDNGFGPAGYGGPMGFSGAFGEGAHSNSTSSRGL